MREDSIFGEVEEDDGMMQCPPFSGNQVSHDWGPSELVQIDGFGFAKRTKCKNCTLDPLTFLKKEDGNKFVGELLNRLDGVEQQ